MTITDYIFALVLLLIIIFISVLCGFLAKEGLIKIIHFIKSFNHGKSKDK